MNIKDAVVAALKELVLPELAVLKQDQAELKTAITLVNQRLDSTNKRLDDLNLHLVDQSRRIDALREELSARIDALREELSARIDETNMRLDKRLDETNKRLDDINKRLDSLRDDLSGQIYETNKRLDRLYEVIVRREEHQLLNERVLRLEQDMAELKRHLAA